MSDGIKTSSQILEEAGNAAKSGKDILSNSAYSAAEIGERATTTFTEIAGNATSTVRTGIHRMNDVIVNRTPDFYDIGSEGEGDLGSEAAGAMIGNSVMVTRSAYHAGKGAVGTITEGAVKHVFSENRENRIKESITEDKITSSYKDIAFARSRKDITSKKDRISIMKTEANQYAENTFSERIGIIRTKYRTEKLDRFHRRQEKWGNRATSMKNDSFSLKKSTLATLDNQSRKLMNRPSYTMRRNGDGTLATSYDMAQKTARGSAKSIAFGIRNRRRLYKGARSTITIFRHPVLAMQRAFQMVMALISGIASFVMSLPALLASVITLLPVIIAVIVVVAIITTVFGWWNEITAPKIEAIGVSEKVLAYEEKIESALDKWWDDKWTPLVMAVMMQESGGEGCDPMQASESKYNQLYDRVPAGTSCEVGITNTDYSIEVGVKTLRDAFSKADVDEPDDMENLPYALQGYNFGEGWFQKYTEWTEENAREYAKRIDGGDPDYPYHVLRYYSVGGIGGAVDNVPNFANSRAWKAPSNPYAPAYYGQCTWFAWGRFYEIYGYNPGFTGNGYECAGQLLIAHPDKFVPSFSEPKAGSVFSVIGTKDNPLNHVGIIISYDGENVTWQDGNYNGTSDSWNVAIKDWRQQTDTLKNFKKRYAGTSGKILFANPVKPPVNEVKE